MNLIMYKIVNKLNEKLYTIQIYYTDNFIYNCVYEHDVLQLIKNQSLSFQKMWILYNTSKKLFLKQIY